MLLDEVTRGRTYSISTRSRFLGIRLSKRGKWKCLHAPIGQKIVHALFSQKFFFQTEIEKNLDFYFELRITKGPPSNKWIGNNSKRCRSETSGTKGYCNKQRVIKKIEGKKYTPSGTYSPICVELRDLWCIYTLCSMEFVAAFGFQRKYLSMFRATGNVCGGPLCAEGVNMEGTNGDKREKSAIRIDICA